MAASGLAKGDRVAVYLDNSPEAIINPATQAERFGVIPEKFTPKFLTTDAVYEVRVIGVPDAILGQAIKAEIVLKEGERLTPLDVITHCRQHLEDFKILHAIFCSTTNLSGTL